MKEKKLLVLSAMLIGGMLMGCDTKRPSSESESPTTSSVSSETVTVSSIALKSAPAKTSYEVNETIDLTGCQITVTYSDSSTKDIAVTSAMIGDVDMSEAGSKEVTITYEGKTAKFTITVADNREEVTITFEGENTYCEGDPVDIKFSVGGGVSYTAQYESGDKFYSSIDNPPTAIGDYALVVRTEATTTYKATTKWFSFSIIENKPEAKITFGDVVEFVANGERHSPTYSVEGDYNAAVHYEQKETFLSYDAPTAIGTYTMVVTVEANDNVRRTVKWIEFSIIADKETPTITFKYNGNVVTNDSGLIFVTGSSDMIAVEVSEGAAYYAEYCDSTEQKVGDYDPSGNLPSAVGTYSLRVTTTETETHRGGITNYILFAIKANKENCEVTFTYREETAKGSGTSGVQFDNGKKTLVAGSPDAITFSVPDGVEYEARYEAEGKTSISYSETVPTEVGDWSLVVDTEENDQYNATHVWLPLTIESATPTELIDCPITFSYGDLTTTGKGVQTLGDGRQDLIAGSTNIITISVPEGVTYVAEYLLNDKKVSDYGDTVPTTVGEYYSLSVTTEANDTYKATTSYILFDVVLPKPTVAFTLNGETFSGGKVAPGSAAPTITVPEGVTYNAQYEAEGKALVAYSGTLPTEEGWYSLVVYTDANSEYSASTSWVVMNVSSAE